MVDAWKHRLWFDAVVVSLVTPIGEPVSLIARFLLQCRLSDARSALQGFKLLYAALPDIVRRIRRARGTR